MKFKHKIDMKYILLTMGLLAVIVACKKIWKDDELTLSPNRTTAIS